MTDPERFVTRELTIGGVTKAALQERLASQGVSLNDHARLLFADDAFTTAPKPQAVRVALVSLRELGLPDGGSFDDILRRAREAGLTPCPLEVAPHLRLDYLDQPAGPYLTIASLKLRPNASTPNGFYLRRRRDGLWLRGYRADPDYVYGPQFREFAFLHPDA